jgi:hypothetical protein
MNRSSNSAVLRSDIPRQFTKADLEQMAAPSAAVDFPSTLIFRGSRPSFAGQEEHFAAVYYPVFETFIDSGNCRKLSYQWIRGGAFHIDVLHNPHSGWLYYKFDTGRLRWHVGGARYEKATAEAVARGLEIDEPAALDVANRT